MKKIILGSIVLLFVVGLVVGLQAFSFLNSRPESPGQEVVFDLQQGPFHNVIRDLETRGLITDPFKFKILARVTGYATHVRVGEYSLRTDMTPMEILKTISTGKSILHPLTVVEGANVHDVAEILERKGYGKKRTFLALCKDPEFMRSLLGEPLSSCEGYLFPETYGVTKYTDEKAIIQQMVERFLQNYSSIADKAAASGLTRHQLVTLASIVEKETGAPEERPIISSVYSNRLRINMKLQADPTVLYGKWEQTGNYELSITRQDLLTPNPYNTYAKYGLPVGPIANPGLEALKAAAEPATSEFLFFVSKNDGTHVFSKEFKDHSKAVHDYQQNARAREGKSWKDLSKRKKTPASAGASSKSAGRDPRKKH